MSIAKLPRLAVVPRTRSRMMTMVISSVLLWYGIVWYGMVWYGMVWYGMVWCGMVWCGVVWCGVVDVLPLLLAHRPS